VLYRYNVEAVGMDDRTPIGAELRDASGRALGGLWGPTELGLVFHGARLLALVEGVARRRGCRRDVGETSSFQAPGFYSNHGYEEFGRAEFAVEGQTRIFMRSGWNESQLAGLQ
jgi:hypothetical protein